MIPATLHRWDVSPQEAAKVQRSLAQKVLTKGTVRNVRLIAGADVHPTGARDELKAVICVLSFPELTLIETQTARARATFPYVPGLLSFREGPALLECFAKLKHRPGVMLFDGQGIAHPRSLGLASHIGLWLGIPSIGCAKSRLFGDCATPGNDKGIHTPITGKNGEVIGACLRSKDNVKPVYVSVGHKISLSRAIELVSVTTAGYRIPEPLRLAHLLANEK